MEASMDAPRVQRDESMVGGVDSLFKHTDGQAPPVEYRAHVGNLHGAPSRTTRLGRQGALHQLRRQAAGVRTRRQVQRHYPHLDVESRGGEAVSSSSSASLRPQERRHRRKPCGQIFCGAPVWILGSPGQRAVCRGLPRIIVFISDLRSATTTAAATLGAPAASQQQHPSGQQSSYNNDDDKDGGEKLGKQGRYGAFLMLPT